MEEERTDQQVKSKEDSMPSFNEIIAAIVSVIVLAVASGRGDLVWEGIGEVHRIALQESRREWGCPSLTGSGACSSYDPARYH